MLPVGRSRSAHTWGAETVCGLWAVALADVRPTASCHFLPHASPGCWPSGKVLFTYWATLSRREALFDAQTYQREPTER